MPSEDRKSQIDSFEQLLNTRRLQMFVRLCEVRHMPSVGSEMGISQPAISLGVKTLEQGVGTALFERSARGLAPTRQALAIEPNCRRALKQLSFIPAEIALLRGSLAGVVNIGIVPVGPPLILPDAIAEVAASHADLRIVTWENSMEELIAGLRAGDIDFIFGPFSVSGEEGHLEAEALYEEDLALLVGQNNPLLEKKIVPEDLLHVRWVLPGAGAPARRLLDAAFMDAGLRPPVPVVESRDLTIVRGLLSSTDMVAALLSHQMAFEIAEGTIKRLPAVFDDAVSRIGFLYHAENGPSPTAKVMMDAIRRLARKYERRSADPAPRCS
jgi:LysR family transcriptional regulator of gallate degradation